ncbi:MAG: ribosomal protein S18-alanine N-acetyltransferase [Burkholderiaceae bacterium]|nr:ribosomal protein S18-alanine N-acetyltransferase [Microbacteriaceae bacterium]
MVWQLRRANGDDVDRIMEIETASFHNDAWSARGMRSEVANPQAYYLVAFRPEFPGFVEGYAGLFCPRGAHEADIQTIAVAESARRCGLGRLLVRSLITEARDRGAETLFLDVRADNPGAKSLYDDLGFKEIAVRPAYYQPDGVDAIVMKLAIAPASTELAQ